MNITIKATKYNLSPQTEALIEEKLAAPLRLLGNESDRALLEIEIQEAPPEGRSSEPTKLVARLIIDDHVFRAEAVKPTAESAADKVRSQLEAEIRHSRGRAHTFFKRGGATVKRIMRFGR
ncbi:MAG: HPF/RaiA family ribosome-associated protein [Minisyncoccia bacterium]